MLERTRPRAAPSGPTRNGQTSLIPQTLRRPAAYLLAPGSECESHPLDCKGASGPDRLSGHRVRLQPLGLYHVQVAIPRRGSAAAFWPQQSVSRTADAAPSAFRVWVSMNVPVPLPPRFSSLPRANNTNALSGRVAPERVLVLSRTPSTLRDVAAVLLSQWPIRIHLRCGQHFTAPLGMSSILSDCGHQVSLRLPYILLLGGV